jgi:hypothetical protein
MYRNGRTRTEGGYWRGAEEVPTSAPQLATLCDEEENRPANGKDPTERRCGRRSDETTRNRVSA